MRRRYVITGVGSVAASLALPLHGSALGQRLQKPRIIGMLMARAESDSDGQARVDIFKRRLAELGWRAPADIRFETRWAAGRIELFDAHARELVAMDPDAVLADASPATRALQRATSKIPIVFVTVSDPVAQGFIKSLSDPGANITGFTNLESTMGGKWLELIKEPAIERAAFMYNPQTAPYSTSFLRSFEAAAAAFRLQSIDAPVRSVAEIEAAMAHLGQAGRSGLVVQVDSFTTNFREQIIAAAARHKVAAIYPVKPFVRSGGLAYYGIDPSYMYRDAATYVDRILKGAKPSELPTQAPTRFELIINLKTASALGIEVPPILLARADEVIE